MSDASDRPASPGPHVLVLRAAFVPDGQQPPSEFSSDFSPLRFRATLDPATGAITCDNAGMNFDGDVLAEWHPDEEQGSDADENADGQDGERPASQGSDAQGTGGADEGAPDGQRDKPWALGNRPADSTWPARSDGRTPFGLAGSGSGESTRDQTPSAPAAQSQQATGQDDGDSAVKPLR